MSSIIIKISGILMMLFALSGCIKETLDPCPEPGSETGRVRLDIYVELFQGQPFVRASQWEEKFCDRIKHLRHFLYKDGVMIESGIQKEIIGVKDAFYTFDYQNLEYGYYELVVVGNCSEDNILLGESSHPKNLYLAFPGCEKTADYFSMVYPFTVDSPEFSHYTTNLFRAHGVVRSTFVNFPENVTGIRVAIDNVMSQKWLKEDVYKEAYGADYRFAFIPLSRATTEDHVMGVFPTLPGENSVYTIEVFQEDEAIPTFTRMVTDTLKVLRNQLVDVISTYENGEYHFEIQIDNTWDGSWTNDGTEIR